MRTPPALLLAAALAAFAAAPASADEAFNALRQEFPAKMVERANLTERVNLIQRVVGYDDPDGAKLLVTGLSALVDRLDGDLETFATVRKQYDEINVPQDVMKDNYRTRTELQNRILSMEEQQREDVKVLEAVRDGLKKYANAKALSTLSTEARKLKAVRAREVLAEGLGGNPGGMECAIRLGRDKEPWVQAAALRGLRGRNEDPVFEFAKESILSEHWPVRLEAGLTLEGINQPRVLPVLIVALGKEDGRLRDDFCDVLRRLTSQNFDADAEQWKQWYVENRSDLEGPAPDTALFGSFKGKAAPPEKRSVYGIDSRSRHILFLIDTSGSMKIPLHSSKGTPTGLSPEELEELNATKIELAKRELKRAIRALEPDAQFNIISFATNIVLWKPRMVKGDMTTKNEAYAFIRDMEAAGGTWTYGALQEAFRIGGLGVLDRNYDPSVDTIYLISDGAPTNADMDKPELQDPNIILDAVAAWNSLGKVIIHAVAIDPKAGGGTFIDFMKKLAKRNNGQYVQRE
jgi:hypothetical protein